MTKGSVKRSLTVMLGTEVVHNGVNIPAEKEIVMEPLLTALSASLSTKNLVGGLVDRWHGVKQADLDEKALIRLLTIECRRNLAILEVAVARKEPLSDKALWQVPSVLQVEAVEAILGQGKAAVGAFAKLEKATLTDTDAGDAAAGVLMALYARISALQALAAMNATAPLSKVRIKQRLANLHADLSAVVKCLAEER
jgi:hypothetical protein